MLSLQRVTFLCAAHHYYFYGGTSRDVLCFYMYPKWRFRVHVTINMYPKWCFLVHIWIVTKQNKTYVFIKQSQKPIHLNFSSIRLTAAFFFSSTILAYTCVVDMLLCPSKDDTVYKSAPSVSIIVAKVCLALWNVTGL